jgi:hypothetical protein
MRTLYLSDLRGEGGTEMNLKRKLIVHAIAAGLTALFLAWQEPEASWIWAFSYAALVFVIIPLLELNENPAVVGTQLLILAVFGLVVGANESAFGVFMPYFLVQLLGERLQAAENQT